MQTTQTSSTRQARKPLPAVHGGARLLQGIGTVGPEHLRQGEILINGKAYFVQVFDSGYGVFGWDERRRRPTCYQLPGDLSSCECMDFLNRADRREDGMCKHQKGLRVLIEAGKLPVITCQPTPRVDVAADEALDAA